MTLYDFTAEHTEAEWLFDWFEHAPEPARSVLGTGTLRIGAVVVTSMANDPVSFWNKALGFDRPVDEATVRRIVQHYREQGSGSAVLQIAPALIPADWPDICRTFGLTAGNPWVKLAGSSAAHYEPTPGLRADSVPPEDLDEWADVVFQGYGMPTEHLPSIAAASARRGAIEAFGVWHGSTLVAGASLARIGDVGALLGVSTLPAYRGRGAQSALIAIRARAARVSGVRRLIAETGRPAVEGGNPSLNNLMRAGLTPIYDRTTWNWTNPDV